MFHKLMILIGIGVLIFLFCSPAQSKDGKPLVFLYRADPWLNVIGSDSPTFALYDDGMAIFTPESRSGHHYLSATLTAEEQKEIVSSVSQAVKLGDYYNIASCTDQPTNRLYIKTAELEKQVIVYGSLSGSGPRCDTGEKLPTEVSTVFQRLSNFQHPGAKEWLPQYVEVMLNPFEYSKKTPLAWPANFPDLNNKLTLKRVDNQYSVFVPSTDLTELRALMRELHGGYTAVLINDKKFALSYRFPFSGEAVIQSIPGQYGPKTGKFRAF